MTTQEAWEHIQGAFIAYAATGVYSPFTKFGLCNAIVLMACDESITYDQKCEMEQQLVAALDPEKISCYVANFDRAGARVRIELIDKILASGLPSAVGQGSPTVTDPS